MKLTDISSGKVYQFGEFHLLAWQADEEAVLFIVVQHHEGKWAVRSSLDNGRQAIDGLVIIQTEQPPKFVYLVLYVDEHQRLTQDYRVIDSGLTNILSDLQHVGEYEEPLRLGLGSLGKKQWWVNLA